MTATANEKLIGLETMRSRIVSFHKARIERLRGEYCGEFDFILTANRAKVIREFRALPDNLEKTPGRSSDFENPTPKTAAEMKLIFQQSGKAGLIG